MAGRSEIELSAVIVCRDDEEHVGHLVRRLAAHLRSLRVRFELLAVDESSSDNSLALLSLLHRDLPELRVVAGIAPGDGFLRATRLAHGKAVLLLDARCSAPLSALGFALTRLDDEDSGCDVVAVSGRYLAFRRVRCLRAVPALHHRRDFADLERRFVRRCRTLGLRVDVAATRARQGAWARLRQSLLVPLASRF